MDEKREEHDLAGPLGQSVEVQDVDGSAAAAAAAARSRVI